MIGFVIGTFMIIVGVVFNSIILTILGLLGAAAFTFLNKPKQIRYVETEEARRGRHIIIQSEPPKASFPNPWQTFTPFGKIIERTYIDQKLEELEKDLKKKGKKEKEIKKEKEELKEKIRKGEEMLISDAFPFPNYGYQSPVERIFGGFPLNLHKKIFGEATKEKK